jgi:phosphonoacetate hydrolase
MDGQPDVIYLQDLLDAWLGAGAARVILPITDPYVVHHGALGSFATVYLPQGRRVAPLRAPRRVRGIEAVLTRAPGGRALRAAGRPHRRPGRRVRALHRDRHRAARHDLSALDVPLRSHGGVSEQRVPLIVNRRIARPGPQRRWRNFDAFDLALNHAQ